MLLWFWLCCQVEVVMKIRYWEIYHKLKAYVSFCTSCFYIYYLYFHFLVAFYVYAVIRKRRAIKKYGNPAPLSNLMSEVSPKRQFLNSGSCLQPSHWWYLLSLDRNLVQGGKCQTSRASRWWFASTFPIRCLRRHSAESFGKSQTDVI